LGDGLNDIHAELAMADRTALGRIGLLLGAATFMVMTIGAVVVSDHLNGRLSFEDTVQIVALPTVTR
jgi:hypothetical protein